MEYKNVQPPENINASDKNPLPDFFILLFGALFVLVSLSALLAFGMGFLARQVPFKTELDVVSELVTETHIDEVGTGESLAYLRRLTAKVADCADLPEDFVITVHLLDSSTPNAFATLGGHVFVYQGLIDYLENENQLAMVLAHEIGHIKHRDPIVSLGRGAVVSLLWSSLLGQSSNVLGEAGMLTLMSFGRGMESDADALGVAVLNRCYGHANGAPQTFEVFERIRADLGVGDASLPLFSTHPLDRDRITDIKAVAQASAVSLEGVLTPLPDFMRPGK